MRPGKLRLVVLMQVSLPLRRPKVSAGSPRQALQPLGPARQPASSRMSSMLFSFASFGTPRRFSRFMSAWTSVLPGTTKVFTCTLFPLRMLGRKNIGGVLAAGAGADVRAVDPHVAAVVGGVLVVRRMGLG